MAQTFDIFLIVMALLALVVFAALHFFEAGYGYLFNPKYGPPCPTRSAGADGVARIRGYVRAVAALRKDGKPGR